MLIDEKAVLTDQDRKYVYVVGSGNIALRKDIVLGATTDGLRIVKSGLTPDDRVIVGGFQLIFFPGAPIAPRATEMEASNRGLPTVATAGKQ
jgi:multidrug efflux system membrane fusion protein